ncbi:hypothetical protein M422DRAFT_783319 [Sphaerobolus stellatus SS14]|uniref:F-box domain-containing protein n=1 Tax=Sphaerobolus stellatus (strain SS14) TaxID=990650 RepID=A0A0C9TRK6_SPHS4|nr:hypothetical protein M422DRAFT_783319 [Sphaerobolus stellatus SS14]
MKDTIRIPDEILSLILEHCLEDPEVYHNFLSGNSPITEYRFKHHPHLLRSQLARVSRRWKEVLEHTPAAWSYIYFSPKKSYQQKHFADNLSIFQDLLLKSGTCTVVLVVNLIPRTANLWPMESWQPFADLVALHGSRLRILSIKPWHISLNMALERLSDSSLSKLEGLDAGNIVRSQLPLIMSNSTNLPLHTLMLTFVGRLDRFPVTTLLFLRHIYIRNAGPNAAGGIGMLPLCHNLEVLLWHDDVSTPRGSPMPFPPFKLPRLKTLNIKWSDLDVVMPLFASLTVPKLQVLHLHSLPSQSAFFTALGHLLLSGRRKNTSTVCLNIHNSELNMDIVGSIIPSLSKLQLISLESCTINPNFFLALKDKAASLQYLTIMSSNLSDQALQQSFHDFVLARVKPDQTDSTADVEAGMPDDRLVTKITLNSCVIYHGKETNALQQIQRDYKQTVSFLWTVRINTPPSPRPPRPRPRLVNGICDICRSFGIYVVIGVSIGLIVLSFLGNKLRKKNPQS